MNRLGPCRLPHQFTVTRLVASTLHPGNVTENDQRLIALPSLPSLPSLWGSPAVLALRFQVGLGFGEPFDHVEVARFGCHMQRRVASEVRRKLQTARSTYCCWRDPLPKTMKLKHSRMLFSRYGKLTIFQGKGPHCKGFLDPQSCNISQLHAASKYIQGCSRSPKLHYSTISLGKATFFQMRSF